MSALGAVRPVLDRGAHQPGRHPRPRRASREAVAPIGVATGEHVHNRVMFKQFLQAGAIDVCQIDACRLGGVNEDLASCSWRPSSASPSARTPAASACANTSSTWRCSTTSPSAASLEDRVIEYVDHLHEHFVDPVVVRDGRYRLPEAPGYSGQMKADSLAAFRFPGGSEWSGSRSGT